MRRIVYGRPSAPSSREASPATHRRRRRDATSRRPGENLATRRARWPRRNFRLAGLLALIAAVTLCLLALAALPGRVAAACAARRRAVASPRDRDRRRQARHVQRPAVPRARDRRRSATTCSWDALTVAGQRAEATTWMKAAHAARSRRARHDRPLRQRVIYKRSRRSEEGPRQADRDDEKASARAACCRRGRSTSTRSRPSARASRGSTSS